MNNKQLIVYKENFITKIFKFFKNLFKSDNIEYDNTRKTSSIDEEVKEDIQKKTEFLEGIKVDPKSIDNISKRNAIIKEIDENIEALNKLSLEELYKIEEYYDVVIKQNEEKIKKLGASA